LSQIEAALLQLLFQQMSLGYFILNSLLPRATPKKLRNKAMIALSGELNPYNIKTQLLTA
jgi:hypothetical protein